MKRPVADVEARIATARDRAIDRVDVARLDSETAHAVVLSGEGLQTGAISGHTWRQAPRGASFGYTLATGGRENLSLLCVVGARDRHRRFVRTFSLPIPAELSRDKTTVTVRFQARDEWDAASANVFECLLVPGS
jgi:hypothetical protein